MMDCSDLGRDNLWKSSRRGIAGLGWAGGRSGGEERCREVGRGGGGGGLPSGLGSHSDSTASVSPRCYLINSGGLAVVELKHCQPWLQILRVQELWESRGVLPGLGCPSLISFMISVDVMQQ